MLLPNPFEYEEYRKKKTEGEIGGEKCKSHRSKGMKEEKKAAVNTEFADRLQDKAESSKNKSGKLAGQILSDDRFRSLFTNPDYETA